jgi:hypothetical protein
MADVRNCDHCGTAFDPRREHERFCSPFCRRAWNSENTGGPPTGDAALGWSVTAMADAAERLAAARAMDVPHALAVISESVWWVTIVDATMIRYHRADRDRALASLAPADRRATEGTFTGLRFVRNQLGYQADPADFIQPPAGDPQAPVAAWTWKLFPPPPHRPLSPRSRSWEASRHREYQAHLAGRPAGDIINRAAAFLSSVHDAARQADAGAEPDGGSQADPPSARRSVRPSG